MEKDHLGDWSPEKDCSLGLTFENLCGSHLQSQVVVLVNSKTLVSDLVSR